MKLGILGHGFVEWGGGLDFLRGVCGSLAAADPGVELHLLLPTRGPRLQARRVWRGARQMAYRALGRPVTEARKPDVHLVREMLEGANGALRIHEIDAGSAAVAAAVKRLALCAVLPSVQPFGTGISVPWLGYIADFQHAHLPQFFSAQEIQARNTNFADMLQRAPGVIVNARSVAHDIERFLPGSPARVTALPFSAAPDPTWFTTNEPPLAHYGIDGPYFIISNQFWQHKDHLCAYRAFARVLRQHPGLNLVCTGETSDFRNPGHFAMLCQEAQALGIDRRLHVPGLIPKRDQIALLRGALAVVQPTLFEGGPGGGSVFDAVALGVPAIVSDVAVNLEIAEPTVSFFKASDVAALAAAMSARATAGYAVRPGATELMAAGQRRRLACGGVLLEAVDRLRCTA